MERRAVEVTPSPVEFTNLVGIDKFLARTE